MQFIETVENSLEEDSARLYFYQKYYQLLCHREFPQKLKKLFLVMLEKLTVEKHLYLLHFKVRKPVFKNLCLRKVHFDSNQFDQYCTFLFTHVPSCNKLFTIVSRF